MRGNRPKLVLTTACVALVLGAAIGAAQSENDQMTAQPSSADRPATDNAPAVPPPPPPPPPPASMTVLEKHEVQGVLGREVESTTGNENMGRIVDMLVDRSGQVRAAIIDFGGFLGVGSRKIAVDWNALHFPQPAKPDAHITLELTRDQVKAAPEYQEGKAVVVLGAFGKLEPLPLE